MGKNVYDSDQIYKYTPNIRPENNPLRSIRGLYVANDYRPPLYQNDCIMIHDIRCTQCESVVYTDKYISTTSEPLMTISSIEIDPNDIWCIDYSTNSTTVYEDKDDPLMTITEILTNTNITLIDYYTYNDSKYTYDPLITITELSTNDQVDVVDLLKTDLELGPNSTIMLHSVTITTATTEDVT